MSAQLITTTGNNNGFGTSNVLGGPQAAYTMNLSNAHANKILMIDSNAPVTLNVGTDAAMGLTTGGEFFQFYQVNAAGPINIPLSAQVQAKIGYRRHTFMAGHELGLQHIGTNLWAPQDIATKLIISTLRTTMLAISTNPEVLDTIRLPQLRAGSLVKVMSWVYGPGSGSGGRALRAHINGVAVSPSNTAIGTTANRGMVEFGFFNTSSPSNQHGANSAGSAAAMAGTASGAITDTTEATGTAGGVDMTIVATGVVPTTNDLGYWGSIVEVTQ